jgi:hypothetical protein
MLMENMNQSNIPTPQDAARRLVILKHIIVDALSSPPRDTLASIRESSTPVEWDDFLQTVNGKRNAYWKPVLESDLGRSLSPREREYIATPMAEVTHRQQLNAMWRMEAAAVLMWALRLGKELPAYDTQADTSLLKIVPKWPNDLFIREAGSRDFTAVNRARDVAELWHWRSRTRRLVEQDGPNLTGEYFESKGYRTYDDIVRSTANSARDAGDLPTVIDDDFPVLGKAYRDLTDEEWSLATSIAIERHFVLNWLCGYAPDNQWDDTPTDT